MRIISTDKAPAAVGPYSQAVEHDGIVYVSGQIPLNPVTGTVPEGIEEQTRQALDNLKNVIEASGSSMDKVLKVTLFITDMSLFPQVNSVYAEFFDSNRPARSCIAAASLPKGVMIEVDAIASV